LSPTVRLSKPSLAELMSMNWPGFHLEGEVEFDGASFMLMKKI
jgi:hypothetical protein